MGIVQMNGFTRVVDCYGQSSNGPFVSGHVSVVSFTTKRRAVVGGRMSNDGAGAHLVVRGTESPAHVLVVQHLHFEGEVFLQVLDDHHQEGQLDPERLLGVGRARDVCGAAER